MDWYTDPKIVNTIGLSCDIVGALLVAIEVARVFQGPTTIDKNTAEKKKNPQIRSVKAFGTITSHEINPEYTEHEKKKRLYMKIGLFFLLIGFALQIVALWL